MDSKPDLVQVQTLIKKDVDCGPLGTGLQREADLWSFKNQIPNPLLSPLLQSPDSPNNLSTFAQGTVLYSPTQESLPAHYF